MTAGLQLEPYPAFYCKHCNQVFFNEDALDLHDYVCIANPKVIAAVQKGPGLVMLTEEEIAQREAEKHRPRDQNWNDWQQVREGLYDDAVKAMEAEEKLKKEETAKKGLLNWT